MVDQNQKRDIFVDILKFFLAIIVALSHYGIELSISAGYAVSVFFMISGYYLAKKIENQKTVQSPSKYFIGRLKKIYPEYVGILLLLFLSHFSIDVLQGKVYLTDILNQLYNALPEFFLLQGLGIESTSLNPPMWYFSVLLVCSYLLYYLLINWKEKTLYLIFPVSIILVFVYLDGDVDPWGKVGNILYVPLIRGYGTMILGIYLYYFTPIYRAYIKSKFRLLLAGVAMLMSIACGTSTDIYLVFVFIILSILVGNTALLGISVEKEKLLVKISKICAIMSEKIYFCHFFVILLVSKVFEAISISTEWIKVPTYLAIVILFSYCYNKIIERLKNIFIN